MLVREIVLFDHEYSFAVVVYQNVVASVILPITYCAWPFL